MRSVFQEQGEVAHVYLGSRRHMMQQIFNDEHEPFWRSAKQMELDVIAPGLFSEFLVTRFATTGKGIEPPVVDRLLAITHAHPYGTQELAYALWEVTPDGHAATAEDLAIALRRVLRAENAHFARIWERAPKAQRVLLEALAAEPGIAPFSQSYRRAHNLPGPSSVQRALDALLDDELAAPARDGYRIAEPFLAEWIISGGF